MKRLLNVKILQASTSQVPRQNPMAPIYLEIVPVLSIMCLVLLAGANNMAAAQQQYGTNKSTLNNDFLLYNRE